MLRAVMVERSSLVAPAPLLLPLVVAAIVLLSFAVLVLSSPVVVLSSQAVQVLRGQPLRSPVFPMRRACLVRVSSR
jgi:hypothetical protein